MSECPSCDHDLSYPGSPGHDCYTYEQWAENKRRAARAEAAPPAFTEAHPDTMIGRLNA